MSPLKLASLGPLLLLLACSGKHEPPGTVADAERPAQEVAARDATSREAAAINGDPLRCTRDERGACIEARPCNSTTSDDACTSEIRERAWSSPIFVTLGPGAQ